MNDKRLPGDELICPFPGCGRRFVKLSNQPECCPKHRALIADVGFILEHVKIPAPVPGTTGPASTNTGG